MKEKIKSKMADHVKSILDKPIITNEDYMLISAYLAKMEYDEQQEAQRKNYEESQERFKSAMSLIGGMS